MAMGNTINFVPPTDRVIQSRHGNKSPLPQALLPALDLERAQTPQGYFVAYHSIPDTSHHCALILYEVNAVIAEMIHNVYVPLLPRFIKKHFKHPWNEIASIKANFTNDHATEFRRVGISCSASLASVTEAPPYVVFEAGYTGSGASKPNGRDLLVELFQEYNCKKARAEELASEIIDTGLQYFRGVGGSILQIFFHHSVAERYVYATTNMNSIGQHGTELAPHLLFGKLDDTQLRIIANPDLFLDNFRVKLHHYHSKPEEYHKAKSKFRRFVKERIFCSRIGNMTSIHFDKRDAQDAYNSKETLEERQQREQADRFRRMHVKTRSMVRSSAATH